MMSVNFRQYLITYSLGGLLSALLVGSINLIVDPDGRVRLIDVPGFNQVKIVNWPHLRQSKALALQQCDYDILILGSSRAETGLNPASPMLAGETAYNAALVATSMYEIRRMAQFAFAHQDLDAVVIGLDFFAFSEVLSVAADFNESILAERVGFWSLVRYALSLDTLKATFATVASNRQGTTNACRHNGSSGKWGKVGNAREAFDEMQLHYVTNPDLYRTFQLSSEHLQSFEIILRLYAEAGVRIYPFISPMHAAHMILIDELGLMPVFETWETELVRIVDRVNKDLQPTQPIKLWDFAGFNAITTEPVPAAGARTPMQWYRDSSHYETTVGDMLLARMLDTTAADTLPADFGIIVTPANIESILAEKRRLAVEYDKSQPTEVANSRRIVRENQRLAPSTDKMPQF